MPQKGGGEGKDNSLKTTANIAGLASAGTIDGTLIYGNRKRNEVFDKYNGRSESYIRRYIRRLDSIDFHKDALGDVHTTSNWRFDPVMGERKANMKKNGLFGITFKGGHSAHTQASQEFSNYRKKGKAALGVGLGLGALSLGLHAINKKGDK